MELLFSVLLFSPLKAIFLFEKGMGGKVIMVQNLDLVGLVTSPLMSSFSMYYEIEKNPQNLTHPYLT